MMSKLLTYSIKQQCRSGIFKDLIGCWEFDETSGVIAFDSKGRYNGTIDGATINQTGIIDKSYQFDGSDDLVQLPITQHFTDFSFSCWFYALGWGEIDNGYLLYKKDAGATTGTPGLYINGYVGYKTIFFYNYFSGGPSQWKGDNNNITLNNWFHFVVTYNNLDPNNDPIFYLNGTPIRANLFQRGSGTPVSNLYKYHIGNSGTKDRSFNGYIDQCAMWRRIITSDEVATLYNSGNGLAYSSW